MKAERPRLARVVVTRWRRHEEVRRKKSKSAHFLFLSSSLNLPPNSAVAPRRGALVVVANSKKTDIKKQGLNSIKVSREKKRGKKRIAVAVESKQTRAEKKLDHLLLLLSFSPSYLFSFALLCLSLFLSFNN